MIFGAIYSRMVPTFALVLQLSAHYWINKIVVPTKNPLCELNFSDLKLDIIRWELNLLSCNFGLKSYL